MAKISQDVLGILRGLQKVMEAGVGLQNNYLEHIWKNSSFKELVKVSALQSPNQSIVDPNALSKTFNEGAERVNTVVESFKGYTAYMRGMTNFRLASFLQ